MEATAVRAEPSASRQKNCNNCVQTKRRCDRRTPVCSRCKEKDISCLYSKRRLAGQSGEEQWIDPQVLPSGSAGHLASDFLAYLSSGPRSDPTTAHASPSFLDISNGIDVSMGNYLDFIANDDVSASGQWLAPIIDEPLEARSESPIDEEVARAYQRMAPICGSIDTWHLYDPTSPLHYVINRVKDFIKDMAIQNSTPFLHPYLYRGNTPQCILACFSATVLYVNRTPANTPMAMRALQNSVRELLDAEAVRIAATSAEKLARTHALFMYQIIRLFDGDITLRAQGEKDVPLFKSWLIELCQLRDNLGDIARKGEVALRQQPPEEWERWIFAESVRRTVIMAYCVLGLYELIKDPEYEESSSPFAYTHRWTLARSLWESRSAAEFRRMWKEKPQFIIANHSFENFLKHGRGDDVDEFGKIFLSVYMGPDAANEFITTPVTQLVATC